jgi:hypothetical protein
MVDYFSYVKRAFEEILKNPSIILPLLINACFLGILFLIAVIEFFALLVGTGITASPFMISNAYNIITSHKFIISVVVLLLIDILLFIIMQSAFKAMLIGMYQEIVKDGKASAKNIFRHCKENFKACLGVSIYKALIFIVPLALLAIFNLYVFFKISKMATIGTAIVSFIAYLIYAIVLGILLFFTDPIIATERISAFSVLKKSSRYAKEHFSHVMLTILSLFVVGIAAMIAWAILDIPQFIFDNIKDKVVISIPVIVMMGGIIVFLNIIKFILQIYVKLSTDLFVFYCYDAEKPSIKYGMPAEKPSKQSTNIKRAHRKKAQRKQRKYKFRY